MANYQKQNECKKCGKYFYAEGRDEHCDNCKIKTDGTHGPFRQVRYIKTMSDVEVTKARVTTSGGARASKTNTEG